MSKLHMKNINRQKITARSTKYIYINRTKSPVSGKIKYIKFREITRYISNLGQFHHKLIYLSSYILCPCAKALSQEGHVTTMTFEILIYSLLSMHKVVLIDNLSVHQTVSTNHFKRKGSAYPICLS